jgi:manganese/iron transport system substrate-binding protein
MIKRILSGVVLIILVSAGSLLPAQAQTPTRRLNIVASFSILADVAHNVAGDAADVQTLIPIGADPHAFEPSAQDAVTLSNADVVLTVGVDFEQTLSKVLDEAAGNKVVSVSACVPVREVSSTLVETPSQTGTGSQGPTPNIDHYDLSKPDQACPAHQQIVADAFGAAVWDQSGTLGLVYQGVCQNATCDPHVWTDPANTALWTLMIRDTLIRLDPANADTYTQNASAYLTQLAALNNDLATQINTIPPERRVIVTNHTAFNYFAARYGLQLVGVVIPGGSTTAEPSVQDVLKLIQTIQDNHVPAIFTDSTVSQTLAQQIADQSGARIVELYTGSLSNSSGPAATYLDYMRYNAGQIADALK